MENIKEVNIKSCTYYFSDDMINIRNFDPNLLDIHKLSSETTDEIIYDIKYCDMETSTTEDLPYLNFNNADGYIEESS